MSGSWARCCEGTRNVPLDRLDWENQLVLLILFIPLAPAGVIARLTPPNSHAELTHCG